MHLCFRWNIWIFLCFSKNQSICVSLTMNEYSALYYNISDSLLMSFFFFQLIFQFVATTVENMLLFEMVRIRFSSRMPLKLIKFGKKTYFWRFLPSNFVKMYWLVTHNAHNAHFFHFNILFDLFYWHISGCKSCFSIRNNCRVDRSFDKNQYRRNTFTVSCWGIMVR